MSAFYGLILRHPVPEEDAHVFGFPLELTFVPRGDDGDLKLEQGPDGFDPDTQVEIDGVAYDFTLDFTATLPTKNKDGAKNIPEELEGEEVVVITIHDFPTEGQSVQMMFPPNADVDRETMGDFGNGHFEFKDIDTDPGDVPVCFVAGTMIDTPFGPKPVESLQAGDHVTLANGQTKRLLMVAHSRFSAFDIILEPARRPVLIPANSIAVGRPYQDLWVSPQHRMVISGWEVEMLSSFERAFAAAHHIAAKPTVQWEGDVHYVHLLFENHEVVLANGAEAESLFLGIRAMQSMSADARKQINELVSKRPDLLAKFRSTSLPELKAHEARIWTKLAAGQPVFRDLVAQAA